jgi:hypothetical protein
MDTPLMVKLRFAPGARRLVCASGKRTRYPSGAIAVPGGKLYGEELLLLSKLAREA